MIDGVEVFTGTDVHDGVEYLVRNYYEGGEVVARTLATRRVDATSDSWSPEVQLVTVSEPPC
jgi:hypothetical protein